MKFEAESPWTCAGGTVVLAKKVLKLLPTLIVAPGFGKSMNGLRVVPSGVSPAIWAGDGATPPPMWLNRSMTTPSPGTDGTVWRAAAPRGMSGTASGSRMVTPGSTAPGLSNPAVRISSVPDPVTRPESRLVNLAVAGPLTYRASPAPGWISNTPALENAPLIWTPEERSAPSSDVVSR